MKKANIKIGVTLYSLSCEYQSKRLSLEDCLKEVAKSGFTGIELVASQTVPAYPYATDEWMKEFVELLKKYKLEPVCYGAYIDRGQRSDRDLNEAEIIQYTVNDIIYASKMGFPIVRTQYSITPGILERMIPYAKKYKVWLAVEMHAPHSIHTPVWKEYIKLFDRVGTKHIGIIPDMGIFIERPHYPYKMQALEMGVREEIFDAMNEYHEKKIPCELMLKELKIKNLTEIEITFGKEIYDTFVPADVEDLRILCKYSQYMHGKYYYIDENINDPAIPYKRIVDILLEEGYKGYLAAEYEGHHMTDEISGVEQLARYSKMITDFSK